MSAESAADAPAKLNLYLHITGRRADGFHLLESLVAFTGSGDRLSAGPAEDLTLRIEGPFAAALGETPEADNLVLKAARLLADWAAGKGIAVPGAALVLDKALPVASGIGGGSADAAAAFTVLRRLWRLPIGETELSALAVALGADVPACLSGAPVLMEGIGAVLSPVPPLPDVPVLLVNPGLPLGTPAVYRAFRETCAIAPSPRPKPTGPWTGAAALAADLAATRNDLEPPAVALCPPIAPVLAALAVEGAMIARMSGSGATCFGLFADAARADAAARRIRSAAPHWWVMASRLRGRS